MRVAVVDLGTFSGLLLIAELRRGRLVPVLEERRTVDLTYSRERTITSAAVARAVRVLSHYSVRAAEHQIDAGMVIATAAVRHAANRAAVATRLRASTPFPLRVLTAREEAHFAARGALLGLRRIIPGAVVVDVGGGSTEIIQTSTGIFAGLPMGAAWATKAWATNCPRDRVQRDLYLLARAEQSLLRLEPRSFLRTPDRVIGIGGTITALAAIEQGLKAFDVDAIHGHMLRTDWIEATATRLSRLAPDSIRALVPFDRDRARVLTAGTYLWSGVLNRLHADNVTVSARGLRWGLAAYLAGLLPT